MFVSKQAFYMFLIQLVAMQLLLANPSNGQKQLLKEVEVEINLTDVSLKKVFDIIGEQTGFVFGYDTELIKSDVKKYNLNFKKSNLHKVLETIAYEAEVRFRRLNNNILVIEDKRNQSPKKIKITEVVEVSGRVTDENNEGLPGVNILVKGTTIGAITDVDGNYRIGVPDGATVLVFSYVGYITEEVEISGRTTVDLILTPDIEQLSEIVVVGYGTQKKSDLTGAIATVTSEEVQSLTVSNPTLALQGRAPGVSVQSNGGAPGAGVNVVIRGAGSINGSLAPLYVVDGVFRRSLDAVNPNDIESIQILKDASAAAIYGSRAANGVVIVTTHKGSSEGLTVQGHTRIGFTKVTNTLDFLNARQYADVRNAIADANGAARAPANNEDFNPNNDTDWQSLQLGTGTIQDYGFSIGGQGKNSSVYFSANYFDETGVLVSSDFNRINARLNSEFWSNNNKFRLIQTLGLSQQNFNRNAAYGSNGYNLPTLPLRDEEGNFVGPNQAVHGVSFSSNRYANAVTRDDETRIDEVFGSIAGEVELLEGLKYKLNVGLNFASNFDYQFTPTFDWRIDGQGQDFNEFADLSESRSTSFDVLIDNIISYDKAFGKNTIGVVFGNTRQRITTRGTSISVFDFPSNDIRVVGGATAVDSHAGEEVITGLQSYYGRLTYNFDDKYLLTATVRQDKSSRFAEDFRKGVFPSVSLGWRISNEDFFPQDGLVTNLKLRASYGELGSQNLADYAFSPVINLGSNYYLGDIEFTGASRTRFTLEDLVWETSKTMNFGLDAGLFNGKLRASIDYYIRDTEDILVELPIPQTTGAREPVTTNAASIRNKGFELGLNYAEGSGDFKYDIGLNISTVKNEVTSLGPLRTPIVGGTFSSETINTTRAIKGEELGVFWGFETNGLYQTQEDIDNDPNLVNDAAGRSQLRPGDLIYIDQNGDGIVNNDDRLKVGSPLPDFEYGLNFNASYKNFEATLFFQGTVGNDIFNARKYFEHFEFRSNYSTSVLNSWTPTNTNTDIPRFGARRTDASDWYIEDGTYLRLKQLRLAYNFNDLIKGVSQLKVFVNAQNLLTFTSYNGYDPDAINGTRGINSSGPALLNRGLDVATYPVSLQVMGGVEFTIK